MTKNIQLDELASQIEYYQRKLSALRRQLPEVEYKKLIKICCDTLGIPAQQVIARSRRRDVVDCRNIIAKELRNFGFQLGAIGLILNRHHSSIVYMINSYDDLREVDEEFRNKAIACEAIVDAEFGPKKIYLP